VAALCGVEAVDVSEQKFEYLFAGTIDAKNIVTYSVTSADFAPAVPEYPEVAMSSHEAVKTITTLADLQQDGRNANAGTARGREMVERSLHKLGAGRSILVDRNGIVQSVEQSNRR